MNNKNKKLMHLSLGILLAAFFIFVGMNIDNYKKENIEEYSSDSVVIEDETPEQCKEKLSKMNDDELTRYVLEMPSSGRVYATLENYNREIFSRYLLCKYEQNNKEKEKENIFENAKLIIKQDIERKRKNQKAVPVAEDNFKNSNGSFVRMIALEDFDQFCPDKLPEMCEKENGLLFSKEPSDWCENICSIFERYKNSEDLFNQDVMNFSSKEMADYAWRIVFAYGLKGEEKALKLCNTVPINISSFCTDFVRRIKIWNMDCKSVEKLSDFLCQ
jgi:hypothetical protein